MSSPNEKILVAKKWNSPLGAEKSVMKARNNGHGSDQAAQRYLQWDELRLRDEEGVLTEGRKKNKKGGGRGN